MADEKDTKTPSVKVDDALANSAQIKKNEVSKKEDKKIEPSKEENNKAEKSTDVQNTENKEVEIPAKFKKLVEEIEKMSVLELSELVKILEEKFGVSGAMAIAAAPVAGAGGNAGGGETEKSTVDVVLKTVGQSKIQVIKAVKEITGKGLKEAKDLVDSAPKAVTTEIKPEEGEEIKKKLEEAGAEVEIK
jgi:large subunit ribosomal protein L7/L12